MQGSQGAQGVKQGPRGPGGHNQGPRGPGDHRTARTPRPGGPSSIESHRHLEKFAGGRRLVKNNSRNKNFLQVSSQTQPHNRNRNRNRKEEQKTIVNRHTWFRKHELASRKESQL